MKTPPNFTLTARPDGAYTAEGPDPDLRIVVAADPIYGVQPQAVEAEVLRMVEEDPTLTLVEGSGDANPVSHPARLLVGSLPVSYTHLTLPTICSV